MKNRGWKVENGGWQTRTVLECGPDPSGPLLKQGQRAAVRQSARGLAHSKTWRQFIAALICFCLLPSAFCLRASGQSYSIDWHKIAGGGGTSSNGQYTVSGTIGQHDTGGPMTGGSYSLTGGFWALISVVQTPGAPTLYISHSGNTVTVYWPAVPGWTLQGSSDLSTTNWVTAAETVNNDGTNNYILVNPAVDNEFYRLFKP